MAVEIQGTSACRTYVVRCPRSGECLVVDPVEEQAATLEARIRTRGLRPLLVIDTHTHADHHSAGPAMAKTFGVPYALHKDTASRFVGERLHDGQRIEVGDLRVEVLHTPGHTGDSVTLKEGRDLLTGDFLFLGVEGAGRLDLPGGDPGKHWESLKRLSALPGEMRVLPGHDYHGILDSSLAEERRRNPRFQTVTRSEYEAWQKLVASDPPAWMLDVVAVNLGTAEMHEAHHRESHEPPPVQRPAPPAATVRPGQQKKDPSCGVGAGACVSPTAGRVPLMTAESAHARLKKAVFAPVVLIDVREPFEYAREHAPEAQCIPLGHLADSLHRLPKDPDTEVLVICQAGGRSAAAAELLIESGRHRVFSIHGGTDAWREQRLPLESGGVEMGGK